MRKCYTYDDINIIPKYSDIEHRDEINISTRFTKKTLLDIPIVASPMDTITEYDMATEMLEWGGVGVIHRFLTIEKQSSLMKRLKYQFDSYFSQDEKDWNKEYEESLKELKKQLRQINQ